MSKTKDTLCSAASPTMSITWSFSLLMGQYLVT